MCLWEAVHTVLHAMSCTLGGYPALRHNELRDLTTTMLREVAHNVAVEPSLQPLSGECFHLRSTNQDNQARLDVAASGIWGGRFERTFIDVQVFNPMAPSNGNPLSLLVTAHMSKRSGGCMKGVSEKGLLFQLSSPHLVVKEKLQPHYMAA